MFLLLAGLVGTVGVLGAARLAAVCDVHGGVAFIAVSPPILAEDVFLGADGLDIFQGLVHKGVHRLAPSLGHFSAHHHLVAVVGVVAWGVAGVHVLPLELHGRRFPAQGRLDPPQHQQHQDQPWQQDQGLRSHGGFTFLEEPAREKGERRNNIALEREPQLPPVASLAYSL